MDNDFPPVPPAGAPTAGRPYGPPAMGGDPRPPENPPARQPAELLEDALFQVKRVIVGQDRMVERALVCLLAGGHCLIEGVPGLAKTLTVSTLAEVVGGTFARIQFTPDLVPADIVGTRIWRPSREEFDIEWGPVFANIVLADEINRAPAKVQSALLEVMAERQVSIGGHTRPVPAPFLVLATQNPIESEGVYALPEAQRDRFLMQIVVDQPSYAEELEIVRRMGVQPPGGEPRCSRSSSCSGSRRRSTTSSSTTRCRTTRSGWSWRPATRSTWGVPEIAPYLALGGSPRATLGLIVGRPGARGAAGPAVPAPPGRLRRRPGDPAPPPDAHLRRAGRRGHRRAGPVPAADDGAGAAGHPPAGRQLPRGGPPSGPSRQLGATA